MAKCRVHTWWGNAWCTRCGAKRCAGIHASGRRCQGVAPKDDTYCKACSGRGLIAVQNGGDVGRKDG